MTDDSETLFTTLGPFATKEEAREAVWEALASRRLHRFPFPVTGRIPNFAGAAQAADRLANHPSFIDSRTIKVNPDAPQRYVRERALAAGKEVLVPTPRLRGGFIRLSPESIPEDHIGKAASLSHMSRYGDVLPLDRLPTVDLVVMGSVAVDLDGHRAGKGEGYADREYAILRELGMADVPVVTTVHDLQVTRGLPTSSHDVPLDLIATPARLVQTKSSQPKPLGIEWGLVTPAHLEEMPILEEMLRRKEN